MSGTSTSTDNSLAGALKRFDIDSTTAGIQTGEDTDSLAFCLKMSASQLLMPSPTANLGSSPSVTNAAFAYNGNPADAATFEYDSNNGLWQIITFATGSGTIVSVDLYVRAEVAAGTDDTYALSWAVGGVGETDLWAASSSARTLQNYSFPSLVEPNDGSWSWTEVSNFQVNWRTNKQSGPDNAVVSVYEVWLVVKGYGYAATGMTANDQYDVNFTIGEREFAMLFIATGADSGTMKLQHMVPGGSPWTTGEFWEQSSITSGTHVPVGNLGFTLTSSSASVGSVKFVVKKTYLATLGATGTSITGIVAAGYAGGSGNAGSGGATPNDKSPSSGGVSWTLSEAIPDFPHGTLLLVAPVMSIYLALRRRKGIG